MPRVAERGGRPGGAALLSASLVANVAALETDLREQLQTTLSDAYRLERELGGGGMSRVFLAEELALGRRVVVKVLSPDLAAGVNFERFKREILVTARLQHPTSCPCSPPVKRPDSPITPCRSWKE